jgi:hypothetical protein
MDWKGKLVYENVFKNHSLEIKVCAIAPSVCLSVSYKYFEVGFQKWGVRNWTAGVRLL